MDEFNTSLTFFISNEHSVNEFSVQFVAFFNLKSFSLCSLCFPDFLSLDTESCYVAIVASSLASS